MLPGGFGIKCLPDLSCLDLVILTKLATSLGCRKNRIIAYYRIIIIIVSRIIAQSIGSVMASTVCLDVISVISYVFSQTLPFFAQKREVMAPFQPHYRNHL